MGRGQLAATALAVAFSAVGLNACKGVSPSSFFEQMERHRNSVIRQVLSCNVAISYDQSLGSGVMYRKDGKLYAITAAHVVADETTVLTVEGKDGIPTISINAQTHGTKDILVFAVEENTMNVCYACKGNMVLVIPEFDVAVLELQEVPEMMKMMGVAEFDFSIPNIGERVYAVGNSNFEVGTLSSGIVQHGNRRAIGSGSNRTYIQTDCSGGPGMSGGGLFLQSTGECIGIVSMKNDNNDSLYAVPMSEIKNSISKSNRKDLCPD